jgi:chromosome segregation ATPase
MDTREFLLDSPESSKSLECLSSNVSTLSGLSEYESEFLELKQLTDSNYSSSLHNTSDVGIKAVDSCSQNHIRNLNIQLQNSLRENLKYKSDLHSLEKEKDSLYNEKIDKLLKQNGQLEANLSAASNQIQRLFNIYGIKNDHTQSKIVEDTILHLEKTNHDLTRQNYLLSNDINQLIYQKNEIEGQNRNLKTEVNEVKLELTARKHCVNELKQKILEQHSELQNLSQNNIKLTHLLDSKSNELSHTKKSQEWYKEELRHLQKEKGLLKEEVFENKRTIATQEEKIEQLKVEISSFKCTHEEMYLTKLKESEKALKKIQIENDEPLKKEFKDVDDCNTVITMERVINHYEIVVDELTEDVAKLKSDFENQRKSFEKVSKENSDILTKYLSLQSYSNDREHTIEKLEYSKNELKVKLSALMDKQGEYNSKILDLNNVCSRLQTELNVKNQEKEIVENSIKTIKEQFKMFKNNYDILKDELHNRNKEILQLQCDKQELYMSNNWKTCELEKRDAEIDRLKEKHFNLEKNLKLIQFENHRQLQEIEHLNRTKFELQKKIDDLKIECSHLKYEQAAVKKLNEFHAQQNLKYDENEVNQHAESDQDFFKNLEMKFEKVDEGFTEHACLEISNITGLLNSIYERCQTNKYECNNSVEEPHYFKSDYVKTLLDRINTYFQFIDQKIVSKDDCITYLKKKVNKLKKNIVQIQKLEEKCKNLETRINENADMLRFLNQTKFNNQNQNEEIKDLQTLLQVKIRVEKDKQKKYERNYRTLLRKVKEHMKGRNEAEKHNAYLQGLHESLSDECNTLKLQLDLKNSEINKLQNQLENASHNEKSKLIISKLEEELHIVKKHESESLKNCKMAYLNDLKLKEELFDNLNKENERLLRHISSTNAEYRCSINRNETLLETNNDLSAKLMNIQNELAAEKCINEQLKNELIVVESNILKVDSEKEQLSDEMKNVTEKNLYLLKELEHANSSLRQKTEEANESQLRKEQLQNKWLEEESNKQNLIAGLKTQLHVFKNENEVIKNEKFFLQRLCNDLKVALKIHVNHNKALKEYVNGICKERGIYESMPVSLLNFPSPTKYDDVYINKLLQENRAPLYDKPLNDIQECFNVLRKEILILQQQIVEKNEKSKY